jgi:Family of unknown function (DUF5681)
LEPSQEQSTLPQDKPTTTAVTTSRGKWVKGKSGNPKGRPPTALRPKTIVELKNDLEIAVRDALTPTKVTQIVNRFLDIAINHPDIKQALIAGKTILDYSVSKAAVQEAVAQRAPINIIIENATLAKQPQEHKVIETTYEVVTGSKD